MMSHLSVIAIVLIVKKMSVFHWHCCLGIKCDLMRVPIPIALSIPGNLVEMPQNHNSHELEYYYCWPAMMKMMKNIMPDKHGVPVP
mmetsp:Transcript_6842/g.8867  ORF Transcript_6842/g.8867 Transcript_6842/m.8867 type:complete len:86 (-) Transcript_6842:251-508(-)